MPRFTVPINLRTTATPAAGSVMWGIRAGASTPQSVRKIVIFAAFDGTAAASTSRFELKRFRGASLTGGTAIVPVRKDLSTAASAYQDARQETTGAALGVAGISFDDPIMTCAACPRGSTGSVMVVNLDFSSSPIVIVANEGICIQNQIVGVIGDVLAGFVEVEE